MKSVGYLVPEWPAQTHAFFWREISALRALGDRVTLFSTRRPPEHACRHEFAREARANTRYLFPPRATESARVIVGRPRKLAHALAYLASLRETPLRERGRLGGMLLCAADLVAHCDELGVEHIHAHSCADAAHVVAMAHLLGGPAYSLTLHGDLEVYGVDHAAKMKRARFVSAVTRPLQRQIMGATELDEGRIPVIWMGVDTERFSPPLEKAKEANRLLLATVARLHPTKGHLFVLEAIRRARDAGLDVRYAVAGEGPFRDSIVRRAQALGLAEQIELLGTLGEQDVLALLQRADAFVLASAGLGEAAPVSVMEAMACGLPVVCSRIGGTGDMIESGVSGILVEQRDIDGLTAAVVALARDVELRGRIGQAARARAVAVFDYRLMAHRLRERIGRAA